MSSGCIRKEPYKTKLHCYNSVCTKVLQTITCFIPKNNSLKDNIFTLIATFPFQVPSCLIIHDTQRRIHCSKKMFTQNYIHIQLFKKRKKRKGVYSYDHFPKIIAAFK